MSFTAESPRPITDYLSGNANYYYENGGCDESDFLRLQAIQDYAYIVHKAIKDRIDIRGNFFYSTWDNFEWPLGPSTYKNVTLKRCIG